RASPGLTGREPGEILDADRKRYEMGGKSISVAQVEVAGFQALSETRTALLQALAARRQSEGLALICLMITDVVAYQSRLLCQGVPRILAALPFPRSADGEWDLGGMLSRKKQLVPALHDVLEEVG